MTNLITAQATYNRALEFYLDAELAADRAREDFHNNWIRQGCDEFRIYTVDLEEFKNDCPIHANRNRAYRSLIIAQDALLQIENK